MAVRAQSHIAEADSPQMRDLNLFVAAAFLLSSAPVLAYDYDDDDRPRQAPATMSGIDHALSGSYGTSLGNGPAGYYRDHSESGYGFYMPKGANGAPAPNRMQIIDTYGSGRRY